MIQSHIVQRYKTTSFVFTRDAHIPDRYNNPYTNQTHTHTFNTFSCPKHTVFVANNSVTIVAQLYNIHSHSVKNQ